MIPFTEKYKDTASLLKGLNVIPENQWIKNGEANALNLFHEMAHRVPAYMDFLKKAKVDPDKIKNYADFRQLPTISKDNYLKQYPTEQLCWNGEFNKKQWTFSVTSGSTGVPFYFPREVEQDMQYATTAELYLLSNFEINKYSTLYINAFAMGAWIGGLFTYSALRQVADRGKYPLSIIAPGINKPEIMKAIKQLGSKFDQIIIGGYPPFVKDLIDEGAENGIEWTDYNLRFIFSAEGFSETFRDYIIKRTGLKNIYKDTLNHYGTVDLGTMAHETPICILLRRLGVNNEKVFKALFSEAGKLPTLTQFMPELFFFEENEGNLICSSSGGFPLVRYDLKDHGGVFTFNDINQQLSNLGIDLEKEIDNAQIRQTIWNIPFVYIYERSDFSVSLYGGNIYPETVRKAVQMPEFESALTGKFTMAVNYDEKQNQHLEINVELKARAQNSEALKGKVQSVIVEKLLKENSEYRNNFDHIKEGLMPKIIFWPNGDEHYFKSGIKQKWVIK